MVPQSDDCVLCCIVCTYCRRATFVAVDMHLVRVDRLLIIIEHKFAKSVDADKCNRNRTVMCLDICVLANVSFTETKMFRFSSNNVIFKCK